MFLLALEVLFVLSVVLLFVLEFHDFVDDVFGLLVVFDGRDVQFLLVLVAHVLVLVGLLLVLVVFLVVLLFLGLLLQGFCLVFSELLTVVVQDLHALRVVVAVNQFF